MSGPKPSVLVLVSSSILRPDLGLSGPLGSAGCGRSITFRNKANPNLLIPIVSLLPGQEQILGNRHHSTENPNLLAVDLLSPVHPTENLSTLARPRIRTNHTTRIQNIYEIHALALYLLRRAVGCWLRTHRVLFS